MEIIDKILGLIYDNQIEEALFHIQENEAKGKVLPEFWICKALICIQVREYNTALNCLRTAIAIDPESVDAHYNLGYVCEQIGLHSEAAIHYGFAEKYTKDSAFVNELQGIFSDHSALKAIQDTVANTGKKIFIMLSSCGWGDVLQRMHHIARSLVKLGQEVQYVCPSASATSDFVNITQEFMVEHSLRNERIEDGVKIYQPLTMRANEGQIIDNYTVVVQKLIDLNAGQHEIVLVAYMPYQISVIKKLQGSYKVIYECVDDHTDIEYAFWGHKHDVIWEQELMERADAITTTAASLYLQRVAVEERRNVYMSRNAVNEVDFIIEEEEIPDDLKPIPEPRIVYIGAIYKWFDVKLFYEVVKTNPDKSFVVIGFGRDDILTEKCSNLYFLGARKHSELKKYLRHMQIGIIPFRYDLDIIVNCDPIKHYEYLFCGLPTITTLMPESAFKPYTHLVANVDEFNQAIADCLTVKPDREVIREFLANNSWHTRAALLCRLAAGSIGSKEYSQICESIGKEINRAVSRYLSPLLQIFAAVYIMPTDEYKAEQLATEAYNGGSHILYIQKQYLRILLANKRWNQVAKVLVASQFIRPEIKDEFIRCKKSLDHNGMTILTLLAIGDIPMALKTLRGLATYDKKSLISFYIEYRLNGNLEQDKLATVQKQYPNSSLTKAMMEFPNKINVNLNRNLFISLVIPTRNSSEVLQYALKTCMEQNYQDYEIIVSDNSSRGNDDTYKAVNSLNCPKIKYFRTNGDYAMIENYEFAYSKTSGDYVLILGSDDGLLLHALEILPEVLRQTNYPMSLTWDLIAYGWPNVNIDSMKNGLFIPYATQRNDIKVAYYGEEEEALKSVLKFSSRYSVLPMFYYNSIIKRELAEQAKYVAGKVFAGTPPDIYTGMVFAYLQKKYLHINMPMSIGGSSGKSLGIKSSKEDSDIAFEHEKQKKMNLYSSRYPVPTLSEESAVVIAASTAQEMFWPERSDLAPDMKAFYTTYTKNLFADEQLESRKQELYFCIKNYGDKEILKWFEDEYMNNQFAGFENYANKPLTPHMSKNGGLILNALNFGVNDVFGAAQLYRNIVGY